MITEQQRVSALRDLHVLGTPPEERFDRVVRLTQRIFDVPAVAVNLIDADVQYTKATVGFRIGVVPRSASLCERVVETPDIVYIPDTQHDARFRSHPSAAALDIRFYVGAPLHAPGGERVGSLCVVDHHPREFTDRELSILRDLADWVEKELATDDDLHQAGELQRRLLPVSRPEVDRFDVAGRCVPSRLVGGDFYDWQFVGDTLQVAVADMMGKGLSSALLASAARAIFRGTSMYNDLKTSTGRLANSMAADLEQAESFMTLFATRIRPSDGALQYVDAGHGLAVIVPADGAPRLLNSGDLPIGILPDDVWRVTPDQLQPGDTLLIVSDGFFDVFPSTEIGVSTATELTTNAPSCAELVRSITDFARSHDSSDDVTALAVRRLIA